MTGPSIRTASREDRDAIGRLAEESGLFPASMLPDMIAPYLEGGSADQWLVAEQGGAIAGFLYSAPELLTDGTHNLRAMATREEMRGTGIGTHLIEELERVLGHDGGRILLVETSSTDAFTGTRHFYRQRSFYEEARIRDFWAAGDDKIIFRKAIPPVEQHDAAGLSLTED